jgi:hypothetical protein
MSRFDCEPENRILVRCDAVENTVEKGRPCLVLSGLLVKQIHRGGTAAGEVDFEVVSSHEEMPTFPAAGATIGLFPFPHGTVPSLTVVDRMIGQIFGGPVLFLFCIYDVQFDASGFIGNVYSVREV